MTTLITNSSVRLIAEGIYVANALHATLPQTTSQNLFTVSGGRVILCHLGGQVTTVIGGTATTLKFTNTPTTGTASDLCTAVAVTSKEVGTQISLPFTQASAALLVGANAGAPVQVLGHTGWLIQPGTLSCTTGGSTTGGISYDLLYIPLDIGAQVVAV